MRHVEVRGTRNTHVTRDHLRGCGIIEAELIIFGLDTGECLSVLLSKLVLRFSLGFDELELGLQLVYLGV